MAADAVRLVADCIVALMRSSAMAAGEAQECHGGHARGSKNNAKDVQIHLSLCSTKGSVSLPQKSRKDVSL